MVYAVNQTLSYGKILIKEADGRANRICYSRMMCIYLCAAGSSEKSFLDLHLTVHFVLGAVEVCECSY